MMKRRKMNEIISPKMAGPPTRMLPSLTFRRTPGASNVRKMIAINTGPPTTNPRNTVRRDHSISPSERSKTRREAVISDGIL